jgi:hypothetical protein
MVPRPQYKLWDGPGAAGDVRMADYFARVWEFICAFGAQYLAWVGAVLFGIDQLLSPNFWHPERISWLNEKWPAENRHRTFKYLAIVGFAVASFQAFDHVNSELKVERSKSPVAANRWEPLSKDEALSLRTAFREVPPEKLSVLCAIPACADLAETIYTVASDLNWTGLYTSMYFQDSGVIKGIEIWSYANKIPQRDKIADMLEHATNGRLKIALRKWDAELPSVEIRDDINLVIGRLR